MKADDLTKAISKELKLYASEVEKDVQKSADVATKQAVQELKNGGHKYKDRTGKYSSSWTRKKEGNGYVVYNKDHYRLTHLLEYGHVVISFGEERGHTGKYVHIRPVEQKTIQKFEKMIEDAIK